MSRTYTIVHAHDVDAIEATYTSDATTGINWTTLVIGDVRLTIHGDHSATASLLMAAAAQCPAAPSGASQPVSFAMCSKPVGQGVCIREDGHDGDCGNARMLVPESYSEVRERTLAEDAVRGEVTA